MPDGVTPGLRLRREPARRARDPAVTWELGPLQVSAHLLLEALAWIVGAAIYRRQRRRRGDALTDARRWTIVAAAAVGAALGSKLLGLLVDPASLGARLSGPVAFMAGGRTVVGAILGGWIAVEAAKRAVGERRSTGDLFALPLCVGIAIGRLGCLSAGLDDRTHGAATMLPWGLDLGDGILRHPAPAYEILAVACLALGLRVFARRRPPEGSLFLVFVGAYLAFRLVADGWKPRPTLYGLGAIQWASALGLVAVAVVGWRRGRERRRGLDPIPGGSAPPSPT